MRLCSFPHADAVGQLGHREWSNPVELDGSVSSSRLFRKCELQFVVLFDSRPYSAKQSLLQLHSIVVAFWKGMASDWP